MPLESALADATTPRPLIGNTAYIQLACPMRTPTPENVSQAHHTTGTCGSFWGHLESMVHLTQVPTTRTVSPLPTTTYGRLDRALSILQHRQTTSDKTTTIMLHYSSEYPHIHLHEPTSAHTGATDASRAPRIRYVSRAKPPTAS